MTIDRQDIDISIPVSATACRCPYLSPLVADSEDPLCPIIPAYSAEMTMVATLSPQAAFEGNIFVYRVDIDPCYWSLDSVLHLNAFLLGHGTQRREEGLQALYYLSHGYWISIPVLIWEIIHKYWENLIFKCNTRVDAWSFPFGHLITQLLIDQGYFFDPAEIAEPAKQREKRGYDMKQ
ncbi:uncharacterized protein LOC132284275 isoform X1 [Cornus florida]|uniref:uncharacterized protein LOC132284275 isoform X1 n=1 Tax=Cornus florida TaxID=4283 RepID=UPI0028A17705|nr:uncharacterized protein LOC132284275 isoform X1 [Cornus florida]